MKMLFLNDHGTEFIPHYPALGGFESAGVPLQPSPKERSPPWPISATQGVGIDRKRIT
jgi:hypothetical protein